MRKVFIVLLVGLMLIGGLSVGVYAQSGDENSPADENANYPTSGVEASVTTDASMDVKTIAAIYVDHTSVNLGDLDSNMINSFDDNGVSLNNLTPDSSGFNVYAYANVAYSVSVEPNDSSSFSGLKGQLQIDKTPGGESSNWNDLWTGSSISSVSLIDGDAGVVEEKAVDYRYKPSQEDTPGQYSTTLTYTISTD